MSKKIFSAGIICGFLALLPLAAYAATFNPGTPPGLPENATGQSIFNNIADKITTGIWEVFALFAIVMFVLAGISFMTAQGDPEKVKTARNEFLWAIVGVVVAILAFSIVTIIRSVLQVT